MLKMYQNHAHSGSSVELWEENWQSAQFNQGLQFCRIDPLRPLFEKYAKKGMLMLEGGCGIGQYVTFYTHRGVKVVGLDFAQKALKKLNQRVSDLRLCAGNVAALPFQDESFDVYYSGGVVEHFEDGAEKSLREAHRVLKKDGVLLISVPYFSPLRRLLYPFKKNHWRRVNESKTEQKTEKSLSFFQYAYQTHEFSKMLENADFEVVKTQGYAVIWGLSELSFLGGKSEIQKSENGEKTVIEEKPDLSNINQNVSQTLLRKLVVSEDDSVPVLGLGVKIMRWATANMMMYVCVRK
ncbi:hypothetical protein BH10ACI1_BH10ACI1_06990 [soil metagenome]